VTTAGERRRLEGVSGEEREDWLGTGVADIDESERGCVCVARQLCNIARTTLCQQVEASEGVACMEL
jgi:hypothetical protein